MKPLSAEAVVTVPNVMVTLFWLFARPSLWTELIKDFLPGQPPDLSLVALFAPESRNPGVRRLLLTGYVTVPLITGLAAGVGLYVLSLNMTVALLGTVVGATIAVAQGVGLGILRSAGAGIASAALFGLAGGASVGQSASLLPGSISLNTRAIAAIILQIARDAGPFYAFAAIATAGVGIGLTPAAPSAALALLLVVILAAPVLGAVAFGIVPIAVILTTLVLLLAMFSGPGLGDWFGTAVTSLFERAIRGSREGGRHLMASILASSMAGVGICLTVTAAVFVLSILLSRILPATGSSDSAKSLAELALRILIFYVPLFLCAGLAYLGAANLTLSVAASYAGARPAAISACLGVCGIWYAPQWLALVPQATDVQWATMIGSVLLGLVYALSRPSPPPPAITEPS